MDSVARKDQTPAMDDGVGNADKDDDKPRLVFSVTGRAAYDRWRPLLAEVAADVQWQDASPYANDDTVASDAARGIGTTPAVVPDFLWENAPRHDTKGVRDQVGCYSHLPHGSALWDSKWALARLLPTAATTTDRVVAHQPHLAATLETHCFRGPDGWAALGPRLHLWDNDDEERDRDAAEATEVSSQQEDSADDTPHPAFDLAALHPSSGRPPHSVSDISDRNSRNPATPNWWVVKDASSNGAGGIWVVGPTNARALASLDASASSSPTSSQPLLPHHRYVAQRYVWPCLLYQGRKAHVRVYGVLTADGRAYLHRRAFLHVANEPFSAVASAFADDVHITNCCANSHDRGKFAGEICATLRPADDSDNNNNNNNNTRSPTEEDALDLSAFFPSMEASFQALAKRASFFVQGGKANGGLEYLGLDFILSHDTSTNTPLAYLLEVNAPPSQDTATGLPYAEDVHNAVLRDLLHLWILPRLLPGRAPVRGGWTLVYEDKKMAAQNSTDLIVPSKAATLNRMRWALFERKMLKQELAQQKLRLASLASVARGHFAYYDTIDENPAKEKPVFFENAGGTQVPRQVVQRMTSSLEHRHRNLVGSRDKELARETMAQLLGASPNSYAIAWGANATGLLAQLGRLYVRHLAPLDEIVLSLENHWAHVEPWTTAAQESGARIVWWHNTSNTSSVESLAKVLTARTRIVALTHVSNILGQVQDLRPLVEVIRERAPAAAIVVDGVAAVPHVYAHVDRMDVDWYVVSCHKCFGPHLGAVCGKHSAVQGFIDPPEESTTGNSSSSRMEGLFEAGTMNYEACAGVLGMKDYFARLTQQPFEARATSTKRSAQVTMEAAYSQIGDAEHLLTQALFQGLRRSSKVHLLVDAGNSGKDIDGPAVHQLPVVSFVHESIPSRTLVELCAQQGLIGRCGTFLASEEFLQTSPALFTQGFVRFSLVHYNSVAEVHGLMRFLETIPEWR
jgi:selenocysteine lyase/cysteine desulfurase